MLSSSMATSSISGEDHLSCSLCLDIFKNPKLLPCHHTFCEACLLSLVNCQGEYLQCPQCRKRTRLTRDDVPKLQTNFYLTPFLEQQEKQEETKREQPRCEQHPGEKLRLLCVPCKKAICCFCMLDQHNEHQMQDLEKAIDDAKCELQKSQPRLDTCLTELDAHLDTVRRHRKSVEEERQSVEWILQERAREIHCIVDAHVARAFGSLNKMVLPLEMGERSLEEKASAVRGLQQKVRQAVKGAASYHDITALVTEMHSGRGSEDVLRQTMSNPIVSFSFPALHCDANELSSAEVIKNLLGQVCVDQTKVITTSQSLSVQKAFRCCRWEDKEAELYVHALCANSDGEVWVACSSGTDAESKGYVLRYTRQGNVVNTPIFTKGRVCLAGLPHGWARVEGQRFKAMDILSYAIETPNHDIQRQYDVYNKGRAKYLLRLHADGSCELKYVVVEGCKDSHVCNVITQTPVAMDVNKDGRLFAVLEEGQDHVLLYRTGQSRPFAVFRGNGRGPFKPSDVCFYFIDGEERLVVADVLNDVLLVLTAEETKVCEVVDQVGGDSLKPSGLLVKPTALCADAEGRLWIGCQGGDILMLTPQAPTIGSQTVKSV